MNNREFNRTKTIKYLIWTFGIAYAIQAGVAVLYQKGHAGIGQLVLAAMMFVPMLGVLLAGGRFKGLGWDPQLKRNVKPILIAWFAPAILTAAGAALYFACFPSHFDLSGALMTESYGPEVLEEMKEAGISYPLYVLISIVQCLTYAPLLNGAIALGEEIGWRGFLYPQLKDSLGTTRGRILGGIIWGAWHWPLIWLIGYEYGTAYIGFPVTGMLLFCVITVALGLICDLLYERSGSIWMPSVFHGAFNAAAGIPLMVCKVLTGSSRLLGPAPNGIIAGLPLLILAGVRLFKTGSAPANTSIRD